MATTVFSACFVGGERYLLCSDNYGTICVWDIGYYLKHQAGFHDNALALKEKGINVVDDRGKEYVWRAHECAIYALISLRRQETDLVFTGGDDCIRGWDWSKAREGLKSKSEFKSKACVFEARIPQAEGFRGSLLPVAETNALCIDEKNARLYAGAGDNCAYEWNIETGQRLRSFEGHSEYLHCASFVQDSNLLLTGSEDGSCKIWDVRAGGNGSCISTLEMDDDGSKGGFVGALAIDPTLTWLCFGGENRSGQGALKTAHLRSRVVTSSQVTKNLRSIQAMGFIDSALVVGGAGPCIEFWNQDGSTPLSRAPVTNSSTFALAKRGESVFVVAGASQSVDVFMQSTRSHAFSFRFQPPISLAS